MLQKLQKLLENRVNKEQIIRALSGIRDHFPNTLTMDIEPETTFDGIRKINAVNWLLGENK